MKIKTIDNFINTIYTRLILYKLYLYNLNSLNVI